MTLTRVTVEGRITSSVRLRQIAVSAREGKPLKLPPNDGQSGITGKAKKPEMMHSANASKRRQLRLLRSSSAKPSRRGRGFRPLPRSSTLLLNPLSKRRSTKKSLRRLLPKADGFRPVMKKLRLL